MGKRGGLASLICNHDSRQRFVVVGFAHQLVYRQGKETQHPSNRKKKRSSGENYN
jgi:hypothetical protein